MGGMGLFATGVALVVLSNFRSRSQHSKNDAVMPEAFFGLQQMQAAHTAKEAFEGAMSGPAVMSKALWSLRWKYGMGRSNTIYAQSLCADEINSDKGHLGRLLTEYYYGRVFPLGGIGGAPYGGKTGFAAFSHHVPDGGNVFVLFGPHIGFSPQGEPGKFLRNGQHSLSTSCGALCAAYSQCLQGACLPIKKTWSSPGFVKNWVPSATTSKKPAIPWWNLLCRPTK